MSFKYLNIKLGILVLGLVVIMAVMAAFGAKDPAKAATSETDCTKPLSIQDQAVCDSKQTSVAAPAGGSVVAWFFPPAEKTPGEKISSVIKLNEPATMESAVAGFPVKALLLFGAAIVGIVFLGRRRKPSIRK